MNNLRDFRKICRVCMSDGSRDIFLHKITSSSPIPSTSNNNAGIGNNCNSITSKSPLNRLLEKLRYVTMMKIEENDDLPRLLCDLCIVQLNVAYNFKNQAVENDTKLRQYFIENGISSSSLSTSTTGLSSSTPSNSNNLILNDNHHQNVKNSLNVSSNTTIATTPTATATVNQRFPIIPFIIKTEPTTITDNDSFSLSDVGIEMNLNSNHRLTPSSLIHTRSNTGRVGAGGGEIQMTSVNCFNRSSNGVDIFEKDENNSSLVYINGFGYNSLTPSSEIESVHNGSGSNSGSHHHQQQQQLQQNHCHENLECNTQENQNNQNITIGRNLSAEIENHNRNAKKNSTNPSSTSMAKRKKSNELKNLLINMNSGSSGGKRNRSVNNTTAENYTTARNQLRRHKFATTSTESPSSSVRSKISRKRNLSMKIPNMNDGGAVAVNKINVNSSVNNRRSKPLRGQKEFLKNNDNVIRETITMRRTLPSAVASSSSPLSSLEHHRTLVINPLSSNNNTNENNNAAGQSKLKKKRLYNEGRIKEKTLTRFIKPKLEPTDSGYSDAASPGSSSTSSRAMPSPLSNISNINNENITFSGIHYIKLSDRQTSKVVISDNDYNYDAKIPSKIINKSNYANYISLPHQIDSLHTINQIGDDKLFVKPELIIREQPVDKFRFRYKSEMHGTHGSLMGENSEKSKKTYPTVELINYHGKALIRCSLYQNDKIRHLPHSHKLVVRNGEEDVCDPHDLYVSPDDGFKAVFQGMGIIHTAKKFIVEELISKKIKEKEFELTRDLTQREITQIKINADREAKDMNLNQVCLAFHAYKVNIDGYLTKLCEPVFSRPINNMKSALTGELKIVRLSAFVSGASGGEDLFLLVEKVGKKNIKVRFYEIDSNDDEVWEDWGQFCEADVHHQYAIALRTPPYKDKNIEKDVEVFIQLERPSDGMRSEPLPFKYKPSDFTISRKRAKRSNSPISCGGGGGVGGLSSLELPETILNPNEFSKQHGEQQQTPQYNTLTLSEEFNKNELLNDLTRGSRQDSGSCSVPDEFLNECFMDSAELMKLMDPNIFTDCSQLKTDGVENVQSNSNSLENNKENIIIDNNDTIDKNNLIKLKLQHQQKQKFKLSERYCKYFKRISSILRMYSTYTEGDDIKKKVEEIFLEASQNGDLIQCAIQDGHPEFVPKMLKWIKRMKIQNVLNYRNEYNHTCLHIACLFDRPEYIGELLQLGVDPNSPDINGNTPLHIAVENNLMMCVTKILQKSNISLNTNLANYDGLTPLHLAIIKKNFQLVRKLIEDGQASVKLSVSKNGYHPLHLAIQQNDEEIVKYLIEKTTVNLNEQNLNGDTPLKLAMAMNLDTIADLLVRNGGRVENEISSPSNYESPSSSLSSMSMSAATNLTTIDCDFENKLIKEDESSSLSSDDDTYYELRIDDDNDNYANDNIVHNDNNVDNDNIVDNGDNIDIENYENKNILFDDMCISQLSMLFNDNDDWKYLAESLKLRAYTCLWSSTENPTKSMFEHINRYERGKMTLQDIIDACIKLKIIEAVNCIEKMMKRQITTV